MHQDISCALAGARAGRRRKGKNNTRQPGDSLANITTYQANIARPWKPPAGPAGRIAMSAGHRDSPCGRLRGLFIFSLFSLFFTLSQVFTNSGYKFKIPSPPRDSPASRLFEKLYLHGLPLAAALAPGRAERTFAFSEIFLFFNFLCKFTWLRRPRFLWI
jgi:hypothetical protein